MHHIISIILNFENIILPKVLISDLSFRLNLGLYRLIVGIFHLIIEAIV